ncbi:MAG: heat-inducible transcriptional repressor HrcA [Candidatus Dormibacteraceae bacterium]
MTEGHELGKRERGLLAMIIRQYVASGQPVGSKTLSEQFAEPLSSATIRNVMAEMEALGYLRQPHTSAGRVPTDKAYRLYVDSVAPSTTLDPEIQRYIQERLGAEGGPIEKLMESVSHLLSDVSKHLGVVLAPALEEKLLEQIKFVRLPERRVLAVIVSKPDLIENKVVPLEDDFSQEELDRTADFLNSEFHGWSLRTIRLEMMKRMEEMQAVTDRLVKNVATLFMWGALAEEVSGVLFVGGATRILEQPDFAEAGRVKDLLAAIEQKIKVVRILGACLETPRLGVQALIGGENPHLEMRQCTFILAPYHYRNRAVGALGVMGPTRMEYERAITMVAYVSQLTSRLLSAN